MLFISHDGTQENSIPDISNDCIVEITIAAKSPQYAKPEIITTLYDAKRSEVNMNYSGLVYDGWKDPKRGAQLMMPPKSKRISIEQYNKIVQLLKKNMKWYAPKPQTPSTKTGNRMYLMIKAEPPSSSEGVKIITVDSRDFELMPSDEFIAIFKLICKLFGDRNILDFAKFE